MNKEFSRLHSTSFLKPEIRTPPVSSVAKNNVKRRVTSLLVLLPFLLSTAAMVIGQGTQGDAGGFDGGSEVVIEKERLRESVNSYSAAKDPKP